MNVKPGVYIGENIELAVTEIYTLIFVAQKDALTSFLVQSSDFQCIHVVKTVQEKGKLKVEYLLTRQGGKNYVKGTSLMKYQGQQVAEISWKDGFLQCTIAFLNDVFYADAHEYLTSASLTPKMFPATDDTLAECLNQWHLGIYEIATTHQNKTFFNGIILNTPKHMYLYKVLEGGQIYTRAARYQCSRKGVAFNQNFRQFYETCHPESAHHIIAKDNKMALCKLAVNDEFFQPNYCYLDKNTFYWSIGYYDTSKIVLNGCNGDYYHWIPGMQIH